MRYLWVRCAFVAVHKHTSLYLSINNTAPCVIVSRRTSTFEQPHSLLTQAFVCRWVSSDSRKQNILFCICQATLFSSHSVGCFYSRSFVRQRSEFDCIIQIFIYSCVTEKGCAAFPLLWILQGVLIFCLFHFREGWRQRRFPLFVVCSVWCPWCWRTHDFPEVEKRQLYDCSHKGMYAHPIISRSYKYIMRAFKPDPYAW